MADLSEELSERLASVAEAGLYRRVRSVDSPQGPRIRLDGKPVVHFSSNDYLGLANHPDVKKAMVQGVEEYGAGSGASRLISGSLRPHEEAEEALATFKGTEAALMFSSGYATAIGTVTALVGREDIVIIDKLVHASLVDAARLTGAMLRVFPHNRLERLEHQLKWASEQARGGGSGRRSRILVIVESVYSMDGDLAPLKELVELKERYGAWLMVDEAHSTGIYGSRRSGLVEAQGVRDRVEVQMGTLGKALGLAGGFICGGRTLIDHLINSARSFIFSTAPSPGGSAAVKKAVQVVRGKDGKERVEALWRNVRSFRGEIKTRLPTADIMAESEESEGGETKERTPYLLNEGESPILPIWVGCEQRAVDVANKLLEQGIYVPGIRYPSVARGQARLRVTLSSEHTENEIKRLADALRMVA